MPGYSGIQWDAIPRQSLPDGRSQVRWIPVYPGSFFVRDVRAPHAGQSSGPDHRAYDPAARARRPDLSPIVDTPRNTP